MNIELATPDFESISDIEVDYKIGYSRLNHNQSILVISYSGKYGDGSGGNEDATYMNAKKDYAIALLEPHGVVLDFSNLHYDWGDMIENILLPHQNLWANSGSGSFPSE